jgi:MFS family permease
MNTKDYIKSLFRDYEETEALRDFMEELQSNLDARIVSLVRKGQAEDEAFARATGELGDISVLAAELSLKRRQEVFEDAYMGIRKYMTPLRAAAYLFFGAVLVFGVVLSAVSGLAVADRVIIEGAPPAELKIEQPGVIFGILLVFLTASIAGLTFLGVSQETAARHPLKVKRALWYSLAAALIVFGLTLFPLVYFTTYGVAESGIDRYVTGNTALIGALVVTVFFFVPGLGLLIFLCLTEKNRLKPWALKYRAEEVQKSMEMWNSPAAAARFGLFSGAVWIAAFGLFFALGFLIGFKFSWLAFVFALVVQLLIQGLMYKEKSPVTNQESKTEERS